MMRTDYSLTNASSHCCRAWIVLARGLPRDVTAEGEKEAERRPCSTGDSDRCVGFHWRDGAAGL